MSINDTQLTTEQLAENLAEAVAEYYHRRAKEDDLDPESLRLIHKDLLVNLPLVNSPPLRLLRNQNRLAGWLKEMAATREAARDLPNALLKWWKGQPPKNSPKRELWLDDARRLFQSCGPISDDS